MTKALSRAVLPQGDRGGFTLAELLVTIVIVSVVMTGAVSAFMSLERAREQQEVVRDVQTEVHSAVEQIVRLLRNADSVATTSTSSRLEVVGGIAGTTCGASVCWVEATPSEGLKIGPQGGSGRVIAGSVTAVDFRYGLDADGDGKVDCGTKPTTECFGAAAARAEDILGVLMRLHFGAERGRGRFADTIVVHAALRSRVLERISF